MPYPAIFSPAAAAQVMKPSGVAAATENRFRKESFPGVADDPAFDF